MYTPEWAEAQFLVTVQGDGQRAVLCQGWAACTREVIECHFGNPRPAVVRLPAQPDDDDLLAVAYIAQQEDRERWLHACVMPAPPGDWDLKDAAKARAYNHIRQQLYREAQT
jgi:hypothetical protein